MSEKNRFPELSQKQITRIKAFGEVEKIPKGTILIKGGKSDFDFFVLLKGKIRIQSSMDKNHIIVIHTKNQFTGDSDMLSSRTAHFDAIAQEDCKVIRVRHEQLFKLIAKYVDISDLLLSTFILRQNVIIENFQGGLQLVGSKHSKSTYAIRDFLSKNYIWHSWLAVEDENKVNDILSNFKIKTDELPILIDNHGVVHKKPSLKEVAEVTGVILNFNNELYDVIVVGAGPGGLGASVYAASEGLKVVTVDGNYPGGQAGKSSKIENYLGFPTGISGEDLAKRAYLQAQKFGCHISIPHLVKKLEQYKKMYQITFDDGSQVLSKAVIIATGAEYKKLPIPNFEKFEGQGVYYSASTMNLSSCIDQEVAVIGGGNSAGQAALFLSEYAKKVHLIVRSDNLDSKMSDYLVQRIFSCENIQIHLKSEILKLDGEDYLEQVTIATSGKDSFQIPIENLFTFIGARPCTEWLSEKIKKDTKGFILTGHAASSKAYSAQSLETNLPGIFAVGDVREGSIKRVASAVGEGAMVVSQLHHFLSKQTS